MGFQGPNMSSDTSAIDAASLQSEWVRQHQNRMTACSQNFSCAANMNSNAHNTSKKHTKDAICQALSALQNTKLCKIEAKK